MGTIVNSPRPNGPIGYVTIGGQRLPVEADPVWWRYWTEQQDAARFLLPGTIGTTNIAPGGATDVLDNEVASFVLTADAFTPDSQAVRDLVIGIPYRAPVACKVIATLTALWEVTGAAPAVVDIIGGIHISGAFSGLNDTFAVRANLTAPAYADRGSISTSRTFTVSTGVTNTFVLLVKMIRPGTEAVTLSNIFLRLEAIKA